MFPSSRSSNQSQQSEAKQRKSSRLWRWDDAPEQPVIFHHPISRDPRCEEQVALASAASPVPKRQVPQPQIDQGLSIRSIQLTHPHARCRIERIDHSIPKISDQQVTSKTSEASRSQRHSPRRIQRTVADQSRLQDSVCAEHIHKPIAWARTSSCFAASCFA